MKLKLKYVVNEEVYDQFVNNAFIHDNGFIYVYTDKEMMSKLEKVINMSAATFISADVLGP
jgi:hypothetical protein